MTDERAPMSGDPPTTGESITLACNGLVNVRTMWIIVDPLQSRRTPSGIF